MKRCPAAPRRDRFTRVLRAGLAPALLLCFAPGARAGWELVEKFADGNFTASPAWGGDTGEFTVTDSSAGPNGGVQGLRLAASAAGTSYLSVANAHGGTVQQWAWWWGRRAQAVTSANHMRFWVFANEANLESATVDGYVVRYEDPGAADKLIFTRVDNGTATGIATGAVDLADAVEDFGFCVRVTHSNGTWSLFTSDVASTNGSRFNNTADPRVLATNLQCSVSDSTHTPSGGYVGLECTHSSGADARAGAELDQVYYWKSNVLETIAFQSFDTGFDSWAFTTSPPAYEVTGYYWKGVTNIGNNIEQSDDGTLFWGMYHQTNDSFHTLRFDPIDVAGYTNVQVSFRYWTAGYDPGDVLRYSVAYDQGSTWGVYGTNSNSTSGWTPVVVDVPSTANSVRISLESKQGGSDAAGWDSVKLTGYAAAEIGVLGTNREEVAHGSTVPSTALGTDFGTGIVDSATIDHTFVVTNSGSKDLVLTDDSTVRMIGHAPDFTIETQPATTNLEGGKSTSFEIRFAPSASGLRTAKVSIVSTDLDETPYTFRVQGAGVFSTNSDIVAQGGTTDNIAYHSYQEAADLTAANSISLFTFRIRDGGAGNDLDSVGTELTDVSFSVGNSGYVRRLGLYDGTTEIAEQAVSGATVTFNGLSGANVTAADNGTRDLTLRASFTTNVTDNERVTLDITAATASASGSGFALTDAGGAQSDRAGDNDRIEATATKLVFLSSPVKVVINSNFTATVRARDANEVRDLDATASVGVAEASGAGTLSGGAGQALVAGAQAWSALQISAPGTFTITATNGSLAAAVSTNIEAYILYQGFETGPHENWDYTPTAGSGTIAASTDRSLSGTNSLKFSGSNAQNSDPYAVFDNVDLRGYKDVSIAVAFAANGPDSDDDLHLDLSYDGGTSWTGSGTVKLVDGYDDADIAFGSTNAADPATVAGNSWSVNVGNAETQVRVRVRFDERTGQNNTADHYYIDDVSMSGAIRDRDSTVEAPGAQVAGTTLSSLADTAAEAVNVFKFKITDTGNNDGDPTRVTTVTIKSGGANTADWTDAIQDVLLKHGTTNIVVDTVGISDTAITITIDADGLVVPDGTSREITMQIYLNTGGIQDGAVLQFFVDADAHGFTSDYATGSGLKPDFGSDVTSESFTLTVVATGLGFADSRPPTAVGLATDFDVEVRAVDANGNRDTGAGNAVSLYRASGIGTLSSAGLGLSAVALTNGTRHWADVQMNAPGTFTILASNATLGTVVSDEIVAGGVWINEVDYDNPGDNTNEWIEFAGTAGLSLDQYEFVLIDSNGQTYATWDLAAAGLSFTDEHNGFGFLTWGIVPPAQGKADYTPPSGWTKDEIQLGPDDSLHLRKKDSSNAHLVDYEGNNIHTGEDQATPVADNNTDATTSIYLTGGPGAWFSAFTWTNKQNQATPGSLNEGQLLNTPTNAPSIDNGDGAAAVGPYGAVLNGNVLAGYPFPRVYVCWGTNAGGTVTGEWNTVTDMGVQYWGAFGTNVSALSTNTKYYYRCYATNTKGIAWSPVTNFTTTGIVPISADYAVYVDDIGIAAATPLCIDRDGNGISDTWEGQYLGGTGNDPDADTDSDRVRDLWEYLAGTHPDDDTSYMRVISLDLASPTSDSIALRWVAGTHEASTPFGAAGDRVQRRFGILAADNNAALAKVRVATVSQHAGGTNTWTDANAVNRFERRYYSLSAILGGVAYTNTDEWAMYTQSRLDGCKYLISVPVNLAPSNNLNSTAGAQLARGLFAGENASDSDRIFYRTSSNTWQEFYLVTNASGQELWWDFDEGAPADLTITPGMGFWVERRTGTPRVREDCVLVGASHVTAPSLTIRTNDHVDGWAWNVFGWPFAKKKRHRDLGVGDTPANQLGFAAGGYGGTTAQLTKPHEQMGDQIWVWETNRFTRYYWLMDGLGANLDGRWQDRFTGEFADFSLQPGRAYLYRHHVGTNGTETGVQFQWQPVSP